MMNSRVTFTSCVSLALLMAALPSASLAQFGDKKEGTTTIPLGERSSKLWKVGVTIRAMSPCRGIYATVPVPTDWPEQKVTIHTEDISKSVKKIRYQSLANGAKQMVVQIPSLGVGEEGKALVTFEVKRSAILPPDKPEQFMLPKKTSRETRQYLLPSPLIETKNAKIVSTAKQLRNADLSAWKQIESIYDFVREKVEYKDGPIKGALAALNDGTGDCEELTSLFIALCRVNKIPARTVWVPNHCYPEFYLVDEAGNGRWFPCQAAGSRDFGGIPELRPVLQKGDNFKVPKKRGRQRYVSEFLEVKHTAVQPEVRFIRELVVED